MQHSGSQLEHQNMVIKRITDFELNVCLFCNRASHIRIIKTFFALVSRLGDGVFWYTLILLLPFIYGFSALTASMHMLVIGAVALAVYKFIKNYTERPRPCVSHKGLTLGAAPLDQYSFPSGHTMHAVSFSVVALNYYPELAVLLIPFSVLVAASRIILGLHYPTDVLAGSLLGALLASLSFLI